MRRLTVLSSVLVALLAPRAATAADPPVRREHVESDQLPPPSVRLPLVLGGLGFTAGWWAAGAGSAFLANDDPAWNHLKTPVIGPFQAIRAQSCDDCGFMHYFSYPWFAFLGLAQVGGLGIALEGLLVPTRAAGTNPVRQSPLRTDTPPADAPEAPAHPESPAAPAKPMFFLPSPVPMGKGGFGLAVGGLF
ncbi:MAG: hypothetical protein IT374_11215 [Polyangiaceae bacterium]|nr:hypothetical protein [Polyangiaceae bacterium]